MTPAEMTEAITRITRRFKGRPGMPSTRETMREAIQAWIDRRPPLEPTPVVLHGQAVTFGDLLVQVNPRIIGRGGPRMREFVDESDVEVAFSRRPLQGGSNG